ncbi:MAP kinase-activating death domain protein-like [Symphalangus syndactylus]|uniref:MAP kinase-activating death domain protein-like n=1 Tax=Symphalangus syndactylus TaxID=9590 RepID=UPI0024426DBC|nr:MAP kinase-activating death domain protein-like [Symphalangus syndactylus]
MDTAPPNHRRGRGLRPSLLASASPLISSPSPLTLFTVPSSISPLPFCLWISFSQTQTHPFPISVRSAPGPIPLYLVSPLPFPPLLLPPLLWIIPNHKSTHSVSQPPPHFARPSSRSPHPSPGLPSPAGTEMKAALPALSILMGRRQAHSQTLGNLDQGKPKGSGAVSRLPESREPKVEKTEFESTIHVLCDPMQVTHLLWPMLGT